MVPIFLKKNNQKGAFIIELTLVVMCIFIIAMGIYFTYERNSRANLIKNEVYNVTTVSRETAIISTNSRYSSLNTQNISELKIIPESLTLPGGKMKSNLSNGIDVSTIYNNKDKHITHVKMTYEEFNGNFCASYLTAIANTTAFISVGEYILKNEFVASEYKAFDIPFAVNSCELLTSSYGKFPMVLIFSL